MMSNSFKKYVLGIGVCCVTAASLPVLTACSDWNDHYEDQAGSPGSQLTLWQTRLLMAAPVTFSFSANMNSGARPTLKIPPAPMPIIPIISITL